MRTVTPVGWLTARPPGTSRARTVRLTRDASPSTIRASVPLSTTKQTDVIFRPKRRPGARLL